MYQDLKKVFKKCPAFLKKVLIGVMIIGLAVAVVMFITSAYMSISAVVNANMDSAKYEAYFQSAFEAMSNYDRFEDKLGNADPFGKTENYTNEDALNNTYRVEFLNVGTADATIVTNGTDTFVIDTGDVEDGKLIVDRLKRNGVENVSIMLTNSSAVRAGGFQAFVSEMTVNELIVSVNADASMTDVIAMANNAGVAVRSVGTGDKWNVGEAEIEILSAEQNIITRIDLQATTFVLMSDASLDEEAALYESNANIEATVLKVSNNGKVASDMKVIRAINPKYTIVSCGKDTANRAFLNEVRKCSTVFETSKWGSIFVLTDGVNCKVSSDISINCDA